MSCAQFPRLLARLLALCFLSACAFFAQIGLAQPQDAEQEPTLPEVLVQPQRESVAEEPSTDSVPTTGPSATGSSATGPYDLPISYPNLKQLKFDNLNSITRSRTSIFDDPPLTTIIRPEDMRERQPRNMVEAIEGEVGVSVQRTGAGQASPFIRGLTGPQTLILVDGIRMNNSTFRFGPNQYFATIDPGTIERIEIVRGPQSVLWGADAIGGVINVVTRSADTNFNYHGGQFIERFRTSDSGPYTRMNVEGSVSRMGLFGGASYFAAQNLDRGGGLGPQPFTNYDQYGADIKFDYALSDTQLLTVALQHFEQHNVPRTDKWPKESRRFDPQMRDLGYIRWQGNNYGGLLFDRYSFTASFQRMEERSLKRKPPTGPNLDIGDFDCGTTGLGFVLAKELGWIGTLTYGVDWYHDEVNATKSRYSNYTGEFIKSLVPQFPSDSYYEQVGTYLQWQTDITERLASTAGVRFSNIDAGATVDNFDTTDPNFPNVDPILMPIAPSFQDWTASIGLTYKLLDNVNLVGSISEGFRPPDLDELTTVSDNVYDNGVDLPSIGLAPETSINYEVGLKFNFPRLRGQMFCFWNNLHDLIQRDLVLEKDGIQYYRRRNIAEATVQGFELTGEYLLDTRWSVFGNFSTIYGQDISTDTPMRRIPPRQGILGLRRRDREDNNWFDIYGWFVARQDRLSPGDIRDSRIPDGGTPGYATLNVRYGRMIGRRQRITLGLENITDKLYRVHGSGVDGPGITGDIGYEYQF